MEKFKICNNANENHYRLDNDNDSHSHLLLNANDYHLGYQVVAII